LTGPSEKGISTELDGSKSWEFSSIREEQEVKLRIIDSLKPFFHAIELIHWNSIDVNWSTTEVLEDENEIEILETVLNSFEMSDFDFVESNDEEGRFGKEDECVGGRL